MHDDADIENTDLVNDEVAEQLANLQATDPSDPQPGQQIQPDPNAPDPMKANTGFMQAPDPQPDPQPFVPPAAPDPQPAGDDSLVTPVSSPSDEPTVATEPTTTPTPVVDPAPTDEETVSEPESVEEPAPQLEPTEEVADETPTQVTDSSDSADDDDEDTTEAAPSELDEIKKQALEELSPLVDKLDLAPEKRYDVIMEMIQASDDKSLIESAFSAAHEIEDDDLRAQALLEIVNEIDYLTKDEEK